MANEKALPIVPEKVPMLDRNGFLARPWSIFFRQAFTRMGGSDAPSNKEIEASTAALTATIASLTTQVSSLQSQLNAGAGLGVGPVL